MVNNSKYRKWLGVSDARLQTNNLAETLFNHLLIPESQLSAGIPRHVDATQKQSPVVGNGAVSG